MLSSTGSADITVSHLGHSVLPTWIAIGPPWDSPWRTPPRMVTASASNFIRAPRPNPSRRRANAAAMSSVVTRTWAGIPSRVATSAGPWDSPAVNHLSTAASLSRVQNRGLTVRETAHPRLRTASPRRTPDARRPSASGSSRGERLATRGHHDGRVEQVPGEQLELQHSLVDEQIEPAEHDPPLELGGDGQGRRPRVVDDVEDDRSGNHRRLGQPVRSAGDGGRDEQVHGR